MVAKPNDEQAEEKHLESNSGCYIWRHMNDIGFSQPKASPKKMV